MNWTELPREDGLYLAKVHGCEDYFVVTYELREGAEWIQPVAFGWCTLETFIHSENISRFLGPLPEDKPAPSEDEGEKEDLHAFCERAHDKLRAAFRAECVRQFKSLLDALVRLDKADERWRRSWDGSSDTDKERNAALVKVLNSFNELLDQGEVTEDKPRVGDEDLGCSVAAWLRDHLRIKGVANLVLAEYRALGAFIRAQMGE